MEMVRKLQKSFYTTTANPSSITSTLNTNNDDLDTEEGGLSIGGPSNIYYESQDETKINLINPTIIQNLPLWRVQWTELPGYQNMLNVWQPQYTHMFRTILGSGSAESKPWYFGHVFLENGSENLYNPEYSVNDFDPITKQSNSKACLTGCLMQIVDYKENDDGRLTIIVQALDKFRIVPNSVVVNYSDLKNEGEFSDMLNGITVADDFGMDDPSKFHHTYDTATVELIPDEELVEMHYYEPNSALNIYKEAFGSNEDEEQDIITKWEAASVCATTEGYHFKDFEFSHIEDVENVLEATTGMTPIANHDENEAKMLDWTSFDVLSDSVQKYYNFKMFEQKTQVNPTRILPFPSASNTKKEYEERVENLIELEYQTWVGLDKMIQLLIKLNTNNAVDVPIPTQVLGLLPDYITPEMNEKHYFNKRWPQNLQLHKYALISKRVSNKTVRVDSLNLSTYPVMRRIRKLSYVIWILLSTTFAMPGSKQQQDGSSDLSRQDILEMDSISGRLEAAMNRIELINENLLALLQERN